MNIPRAWCTSVIAVLATAPFSVAVADSIAAVEASPDVKRAEMITWLADGEHGLWIETSNLKWFFVHLTRVCPGLSATNSLVFNTVASGSIDRRTTIAVPGGARCSVRSIAFSSGPPKGRNDDVVMQPQAQ